MTGQYDEWAAARTPALLHLAHALTGDERAAAETCRRALQRVAESWPRVSRGDPDLEARRVLVRSCPSRDRAAAVLHRLEGRGDAEIATVLGCSEAAARRHLQRGLATTIDEPAPAPSGSGSGASVATLTRPHVEVAATPRRHGRGVSAAVLAVLAVLALVGGVAFVAHESRTPAGVITYPPTEVPQTWRYESYAGVQVQVPDTWGWGGAPLHSDVFRGKAALGSCGSSTATVKSPNDPSSYISSVTGFTGRPVRLSYLCLSWGSDGIMPRADALWFASPLPVGVKDLGSTVAETRAVGGQHVTAFSAQSALRRQVLGTAEQVATDASGCPARPVLQPADGPARVQPDALSVCVYSQDSGSSVLLWSGQVPAAGARAYADAFRVAGSAAAATTCPTVPTGTWVALGLHGAGGTRWDLVDLSCARVRGPGGAQAPLTPATVRAWATGGVTAYVAAPAGAGQDLRPFFRPPSG
ncbi:MAG TPA: sigma factor-like helix-turn-helix DNA-binding protein [Nocardioides sp.]|nr:sigma factor-like helix-turn-helix DNA-binding protein [Nocardioides sp.]